MEDYLKTFQMNVLSLVQPKEYAESSEDQGARSIVQYRSARFTDTFGLVLKTYIYIWGEECRLSVT